MTKHIVAGLKDKTLGARHIKFEQDGVAKVRCVIVVWAAVAFRKLIARQEHRVPAQPSTHPVPQVSYDINRVKKAYIPVRCQAF